MECIKKAIMASIIIIIVSIFSISVFAAPYNGQMLQLSQPNGSIVDVNVYGDEFYQRIESTDGYTLIRDEITQQICYAKLNDNVSDFVSTGIVYNNDTNSILSKLEDLNITKGLKLSSEVIKIKIAEAKKTLSWSDPSKNSTSTHSPNGTNPAPVTGNIKGLTLLIDFPDVKSSVTRDQVESLMNQENYTGFNNKGSIRDYFYEVSSGKVVYTNSVTSFYTAKNNKSYYDNATSGKTGELIKEALDNLVNSNFDFSTLSTDSEGYVVGLNILYAGAPSCGWAKGLWPHSSAISYSNNKVKIRPYQITNLGSSLAIGTIAHENGHMVFHWPDTYDYEYDSTGTGSFDLMGAGNFANNPCPPNPYFRNIISGWGNATILNNYSDNTTLLIRSNDYNPKIYKTSNTSESFFVENISRTGRYQNMPGAGLLIWHIEENGFHDSNDMTYEKHFQVSVEQADGKFDLEKNSNYGNAEDLFYSGNVDSFNSETTPNSKLWNGNESGFSLKNISAIGSSMTFTLGNKAPSVIKSQSIITPSNYPIMKSSNNKYVLFMQTDGNLVLYTSDHTPIWSSNTWTKPVKSFEMQPDGNLVLYDENRTPLFSTGTFGNNYLKLEDDGRLVVYSSDNKQLWVSGYKFTPSSNAILQSENGRYKLVMQVDGNLVLYADSNIALWASNTAGKSVRDCIMQTDGNFVIYDTNNTPLWSSSTKGINNYLKLEDNGRLVVYNTGIQQLWVSGNRYSPSNDNPILKSENGKYRLVMQTDGNLVLYNDSNTALWSSGTNGKSVRDCIMQTDGNFVIYDTDNNPMWFSKTSGLRNYLKIENDGKLHIYNNSNSIWSVG